MATLKKIDDTGLTIYIVLRDMDLLAWNADIEAMEAYNAANWADYALAAVEQGDSGFYYVVTPATLPDGIYSADWKIQAGASPAESDISVGLGNHEWRDSRWMLPADNVGIAAARAAADAVKNTTDKLDSMIQLL